VLRAANFAFLTRSGNLVLGLTGWGQARARGRKAGAAPAVTNREICPDATDYNENILKMVNSFYSIRFETGQS